MTVAVAMAAATTSTSGCGTTGCDMSKPQERRLQERPVAHDFEQQTTTALIWVTNILVPCVGVLIIPM